MRMGKRSLLAGGPNEVRSDTGAAQAGAAADRRRGWTVDVDGGKNRHVSADVSGRGGLVIGKGEAAKSQQNQGFAPSLRQPLSRRLRRRTRPSELFSGDRSLLLPAPSLSTSVGSGGRTLLAPPSGLCLFLLFMVVAP